MLVVPATLAIIFLLLYLTFGRLDEAALIMGTLPFALTGGIWTLWLLGYAQSVATGVGFIALAGVSAEFGVVMLIYLKHALAERGPSPSGEQVSEAIREGALLRVRPKAMTVAVIVAGLFPVLIGHGAGSEVMSRIAAPMIGGMLTALSSPCSSCQPPTCSCGGELQPAPKGRSDESHFLHARRIHATGSRRSQRALLLKAAGRLHRL